MICAGSLAESTQALLGTLCSRSDTCGACGEGPACHGAAQSCSSLPRPMGEAEMPEGHRVPAVNDCGVFQPDVTKHRNSGLVEETGGL